MIEIPYNSKIVPKYYVSTEIVLILTFDLDVYLSSCQIALGEAVFVK